MLETSPKMARERPRKHSRSLRAHAQFPDILKAGSLTTLSKLSSDTTLSMSVTTARRGLNPGKG